MLGSQRSVPLDSLRYERRPPRNTPDALTSMGSLAMTVRCRRGEQVNGYADPDGHWYRVMSGAARQCVTHPDGHRRIIDFLLPGDIFDPIWDCRRSSVEAVVNDTMIASYPRRSIELLAESDPRVGRDLRDLALTAVYRLQRQILILGRGTALERLCSFLLDMAQRSSDRHDDRIVLPMSRYDIADYLGLSVETVSRCLTSLRLRKVITLLKSRELRILDRNALKDGCGYGD
jgi:CRP/FNR family nitrogen fixation transcriptional regulator